MPPRPYLPNIIEVGAMHVRDPKPLPKDLQTFMDSATEGVVFVSFGSGLDPSLMSSEKIAVFLETFREPFINDNLTLLNLLLTADIVCEWTLLGGLR